MSMDGHNSGREIEKVWFHGAEIEAIKNLDGKPYVVIRRICENLGVDFSGQLAKLKSAKWSGVEIISTPD